MDLKRKEFLRFATAALVLALPHAALAQATLTAMDYIGIQQLVNKLNFALDYCTNGGQDFADLFVENGRFVIDRGERLALQIEQGIQACKY